MSDTYWPTDQKRIEARILIPIPEGTEDPQALAHEIHERIGENVLRLTALPFWYTAEVRNPDKSLFDPPERPDLRLVDGGEDRP